MDLKFKKVVEAIDFLNRYKELSDKYNNIRTPDEERLTRPDGIEVCDIFEDMGYDLKFSKGVDKFAYFDEQYGDYDFSFRFCLLRGAVEFILIITEGDRLLTQTHFGYLATCISEDSMIDMPIFSSYEDLQEIFKTAIGIYLDCKEELIKLEGIEFKEPEKVYKVGIPELPILEKIIPIPYHEMANEFTIDFNTMDNKEFFVKYELRGNLWHNPEDFRIARENADTFGKALVRFLEDKMCFTNYPPNILIEENDVTNYWEDEQKVKLVYLYIADGTRYCEEGFYYTYIPEDVNMDKICGIEIRIPKSVDK